MVSRQTSWRRKRVERGVCPRCGRPAAFKLVEQDGIVMDRTRLRTCWYCMKYLREYYKVGEQANGQD